ncbi:hypothetical protein [Natronomonas marina]|jgi:hypothetical protein|uniref:hypothetical protein n=1 Tax=Natronomonas marina TaxID=2961939 RepID=UPI0020C9A6A6|nr:hypothetical protein [Natronomonas marina]
MALGDSLPVELPTTDSSLTRLFYLFVLVPTVLGAAHHVDHVVRGNHVGWPLTPEVNAFTYSLAIYPLLAVSLYLTVTRRVEARYWAGFFAFSAGMLAYFHVSPWAVEPPQDVVVPYANPVVGYAAFAVLLALIASTVVGSAYGAFLWYRSGAGGDAAE